MKLPLLGLGCWSFGGGEYWGPSDQGEVNQVVYTAFDHGINYFDTAEIYNDGRSEVSLGTALKGIPRDKVLIGTKIAPSNCYPDTLAKHCEDSLNRIGTDYIDLYMIHWPLHSHSLRHFTTDENKIANPPSLDDALGLMMDLRATGKIRHVGISNFGKNWLDQIPAGAKISINQVPYNLLSRAIEFEVLPYCIHLGIGIMTYMTLFQGILTGLYNRLDEVPPWQSRTRHFNKASNPLIRHGESGCEDETRLALQEIAQMCKQTGLSMAEIAIGWITGNKDVTCALIGSRSPEKIVQNIRAVEIQLPDEFMEKLNLVTEPVKDILGNHMDLFESAELDRTI
ncbi:MAG: aldo/keto reductase [Bacteroidales bacterium]|nr:aldo/keto reductase [Bacteroidales bacterium]